MKGRYQLFFEKMGLSHTQATNLYLKNPYFFAELIALAEITHPEYKGLTETQIENFKKNLQLAAETDISSNTLRIEK